MFQILDNNSNLLTEFDDIRLAELITRIVNTRCKKLKCSIQEVIIIEE